MEEIVVGIAQINFHNFSENSPNNFGKESWAVMSVCNSHVPNSGELRNVCDEDDDCISNSLSEVEDNGDNGWEEIEDDLNKSRRRRSSYTFAERRQMPTRASKESSSLGIKRRTIMKPSKRVKNNEDFQNLKPADIKKIYLNKKLSKFKPSCLETIFEETSAVHTNEKDCTSLMGGRKIKRSLTFSDGFKYNKTLVNKRRAKIKKTFGKRFALKKISLEEFINKLNTSVETNGDVQNHDSQIQDDKSNTTEEFSYSEFFVSNTSSVNSEDDAMTTKNLSPGLANAFENNMSLVDKC